MLALRWVIVLFLAVQFVISISLLLFIPRDCQGCLLGKWHFTAYTIINGFLPLGILWSFVHPKQVRTHPFPRTAHARRGPSLTCTHRTARARALHSQHTTPHDGHSAKRLHGGWAWWDRSASCWRWG
jgi:hypothetical protein